MFGMKNSVLDELRWMIGPLRPWMMCCIATWQWQAMVLADDGATWQPHSSLLLEIEFASTWRGPLPNVLGAKMAVTGLCQNRWLAPLLSIDHTFSPRNVNNWTLIGYQYGLRITSGCLSSQSRLLGNLKGYKAKRNKVSMLTKRYEQIPNI